MSAQQKIPIAKEVHGFEKDSLNHIEPYDKVVLPNKDIIRQEKTELNLRNEIKAGKQLKKAKTIDNSINNLPKHDDIKKEKTELQLQAEIQEGVKLKNVNTQVKVVMPDKCDIEKERRETQLRNDIAKGKQLRPVSSNDRKM